MFPGVSGEFVLLQLARRHKDFHEHDWRNRTCKQRGWSWGVCFCFVAQFCTGTCSEAEAMLCQPGRVNRSLTQSSKFYWGPFFSQSRIHPAEYSARISLRSKFRLRMVLGIICSASWWTLIYTRADLEEKWEVVGWAFLSLVLCSFGSWLAASQPPKCSSALAYLVVCRAQGQGQLCTPCCALSCLMNIVPSIALLPSVFQVP